MSTSAGWDGFMLPTLFVDGDPECSVGSAGGEGRTCMSTSAIGYFYFISYLLLTFVIVTNMYIAIILENFDLATKDDKEALTADDFEHFFDVWQRHDRNGDGKVSVEDLCVLCARLDRPLRLRNRLTIASLRIPVDENREVHVLDVASALMKNILGPEGFTEETESELKSHFVQCANKLMRNDTGRRVTDTYEILHTPSKSPRAQTPSTFDNMSMSEAAVDNNGRAACHLSPSSLTLPTHVMQWNSCRVTRRSLRVPRHAADPAVTRSAHDVSRAAHDERCSPHSFRRIRRAEESNGGLHRALSQFNHRRADSCQSGRDASVSCHDVSDSPRDSNPPRTVADSQHRASGLHRNVKASLRRPEISGHNVNASNHVSVVHRYVNDSHPDARDTRDVIENSRRKAFGGLDASELMTANGSHVTSSNAPVHSKPLWRTKSTHLHRIPSGAFHSMNDGSNGRHVYRGVTRAQSDRHPLRVEESDDRDVVKAAE